MKGFKRFLMQGNLIVIAVGLVVATAFSTLIKAFTDNVITPLVDAAGGGSHKTGLTVEVNHQALTFGAFISAVVYFVIFMLVIYFALVVPYRRYMNHRGQNVFGEPAATRGCPYCLSDDLPAAATKCKYCTSELPAA